MTKEQKLDFKNEKGQKLVGVLSEPEAVDFCVLCHGFSDSKEGFHLPALAAALAQEGIGSLRFDFSGNGESEGTFKFSYAEEVEDLRSAVEFLRSKGKNVKAILGHSKGGNQVILYGGRYDDIPLIVNVSGRFDVGDGIVQRFGADVFERLEAEKSLRMKTRNGISWVLTQEHMQERISTDMEGAARGIIFGRVLTIHGTADEVIPVEDSSSFNSSIKKHELCLVEGANHNFTTPGSAEKLIGAACKFIASPIDC